MRRQHRPLFDPTHRCSDDATARRRRLAATSRRSDRLIWSIRGRARRTYRRMAPSDPSDYVRDPRWPWPWARRCSGTCNWAAMACRPAPRAISRRRRHSHPQPVEPRPPGRRHGAGDLSQSPSGHTAEAPADQNVNRDLAASDFPTHRLSNQGIPGEPLLNPGNVTRDTNDVVSSMGMRLRQFNNIPVPG